MTRIVYLNGEYMPADQAKISIFDRSVSFGDSIYDVAGVLEAKLVDFDHHIQRYFNSLEKLEIDSPLSKEALLKMFRELVSRNQLSEGLVYLQVTRGVAERNFVWPDEITPTIFAFTQVKESIDNEAAKTGVILFSTPDIRWARRDIKSTNMLAQVLAKKLAHDAGAYEALMVDDDGFITECGCTSFFIVKGNRILTRPLSNNILPGVTRRALIELCSSHDLQLVEEKFTLEDVYTADEAFISSASSYLLPVSQVDQKLIGNGLPGSLTQRLREIYLTHVRESLS